ncbi:hypothetical protein K3495_g3810 [Podosphaera aphanis]|nr:hypothetical protein K3495_g3810 [Podosphaera aphanis]
MIFFSFPASFSAIYTVSRAPLERDPMVLDQESGTRSLWNIGLKRLSNKTSLDNFLRGSS